MPHHWKHSPITEVLAKQAGLHLDKNLMENSVDDMAY